MPKNRTKTKEPIRLDFRSVERIVVVPDNEDRFVTTAREAARACKQAEDAKEWVDTFKQFLAYLHEWCEAHAQHVSAGYVDVADAGMTVVIATKGDRHAFDFEDTVTDLDLQIVEKFPWAIVEMMQVPGKLAEAQLSTDQAILVYGDRTRAQTARSA